MKRFFLACILVLLLILSLPSSAPAKRILYGKIAFSLLTYGPSLSGEIRVNNFFGEAGVFAGLIDEGWFVQGTYGVVPGRINAGAVYKDLSTHDELLTLGLADEESDYSVFGSVVEIHLFKLLFAAPFVKGELLYYQPAREEKDSFSAFNVQLGLKF
ncbi:MAG TPA: hypothetical protein ENN72_07125 [Firmicutes bacterium]|nr:hypothetical protein [Bacillota bacterium]